MNYAESRQIELSPRRYRQVARAKASQGMRQRILDAFADALLAKWMDEITLDGVAEAAGTTRQTVIRVFGGKDGLLREAAEKFRTEVAGRRAVAPDAKPRECVRALVQDYEVLGDSILRLLAQEGRYPDLSILLDRGRRGHRQWVSAAFAAGLARHAEAGREALVTQLVVATDVYAWKLLRRDRGLSPAQAETLIASMVTKLLEEEAGDES